MDRVWKNVSFALGAMLVGSLLTGVVMTLPILRTGDAQAQDRTVAPPQNRTMVDGQNLAAAQDLSSAFRNVADLLRPSVVSISVKQTQIIRRGGGLPPGFRVPRGFEGLFDEVPRGEIERRQRETGMGSGVIVRDDGYILTNNHVIEDAGELDVELSDGRTVAGKIIGTDPETDLAVIKIEANGLQAAAFGDSDAIRVGDWVLAIGSPFGLDQTVTAGIISGKNRDQDIIKDGEGFEDFLQTDAAINPGNSGGALVNLRGELIGINTAILSRSGASAGIGFAIPVSIARPVLNSIIDSGIVRRGFLGASVVDVTPRMIQDFNLKVQSGAMVGSVLEDQPASRAGLQPGDVVTKMDGRLITTGTQLRNYIASRPPGSVIKMEINRGGKAMKVDVNLQERTESALAGFKSGEVMGAELAPATPEIARRYGYANLRGGLVVTEIKPNSEADEAGLQVGDVLQSAANVVLESAAQLKEILDEGAKRQQAVRVVVRRGRAVMLMSVR